MNLKVVVAQICLLASVSVASLAIADDATKKVGTEKTAPATPTATAAQPAPEHRTILPNEIKWADAPQSLPKGAKVAVIHGDPNAAGIFAMRVWIPDGYKVPPHWHPANEHATVISGEFHMGLGEVWDESKGHTLPAGAVSVMPAGMRHFAWNKGETVIQIHAMGPWGINYVNPQDDPRNKKEAAK